ncbi:MAG: Ig-like domain-containing protein [Anaerolineae bacterium]
MNDRRVFKLYLGLALALLLAACKAQAVTSVPHVWIDVPADGMRFPVDQAIRIEGHASYAGGIERVEIWANGELHLVQESPPTQGNMARFEQSWMPPGAGEYIVQAVAVGSDGAESAPDVVRLYVGDAVAEATPTHTPVPESTKAVEPTSAITATETPTSTATIPVPTRTATPIPTSLPDAVIDFWADAGEIEAGKCTKLHWKVQNVQAVFLDGKGVVGEGSQEVCPCEDTTYILSVTLLDGAGTERSVTIRVKGSCVTPTSKPTVPPPDTTPPPVPPVVAPTGGAALACDKVTLDWDAVSDPSGIAEYRVQVEQEITAGNWESVSGSPWTGLSGPDLELDLSCGGVYRWRVRAVDGAGNVGDFSAWAEFGVDLP